MKQLENGKRRSVWLAAIVIGVLVLVAGFVVVTSETGTADQAVSGMQVQAIGNVRIREEPGVTANRVGALEWGESARVKGVDTSGLWYRIEANGLEGWAAADWFVTISQDQSRSASEPLTSPTGVVVRALDGVRIRAQPSLRGTRLGIIPWGERAAVLAISQSGQWYQIDYNGLVGWSASQWLQVDDGDLASVSSVAPLTHVRALGNVRIRANPSLDGDIISMIYTGNHALVLGTDASGQWHQIDFRGTVGWSSAEWFEADPDYIEPGGAQAATEPDEAPPVPQIRPGTVLIQLGEDLVQIHETPETTSATLGVVRNQGHVTLLAVDESGEWYHIAREDLFGWVLAPPFQSTGQVLVEVPVPPTVNPEVAEPSADSPEESPLAQAIESAAVIGLVESQFDDVPLRAIPETGGEIVIWLGRGDQATVLESDASGDWYHLQVGDEAGWAHTVWFASVEATPPADAQQVASQFDDVPLRATPATGGELVIWLERGDQATVLETDASGDWYHLQVGDESGWAHTIWFASVEALPPADAQQVESQFDDVPLRANPATSGELVIWLGRGDQATLLETDASGDWYHLQVGDESGWAHTIWFASVEAGLPADAQQVESQFDDVPVRQLPQTSGEILAWLGRGDQVAVLESDASGDWYSIQFGDVTGWARAIWFSGIDVSLPADAQQVESQYDDVPLRATPETGGELVIWLARGDQAVVLNAEDSGEWYRLRVGDVEGWAHTIWFTTVDPQPEGIGVGTTVISEGTAVRILESPDVESFTEDVIQRGETAQVLAIDESGMWYQIEFEGLTGWSAAEWFALVE